MNPRRPGRTRRWSTGVPVGGFTLPTGPGRRGGEGPACRRGSRLQWATVAAWVVRTSRLGRTRRLATSWLSPSDWVRSFVPTTVASSPVRASTPGRTPFPAPVCGPLAMAISRIRLARGRLATSSRARRKSRRFPLGAGLSSQAAMCCGSSSWAAGLLLAAVDPVGAVRQFPDLVGRRRFAVGRPWPGRQDDRGTGFEGFGDLLFGDAQGIPSGKSTEELVGRVGWWLGTRSTGVPTWGRMTPTPVQSRRMAKT